MTSDVTMTTYDQPISDHRSDRTRHLIGVLWRFLGRSLRLVPFLHSNRREFLDGKIKQLETECRILRNGSLQDAPSADSGAGAEAKMKAKVDAIECYLELAKEGLDDKNTNAAYRAYHAARRERRLLSRSPEDLHAELVALRRDAVGNARDWRYKAIVDLIGPPNGENADEQSSTANPRGAIEAIDPRTLRKAMRLRDDAVEYRFWHKSILSTHISIHFTVMAVAITVLVLTKLGYFYTQGSASGEDTAFFPTQGSEPGEEIAFFLSSLFGALGASISALIHLARQDETPDQFVSKLAVLARPLIGAIAGLFAAVLLKSKLITIGTGPAEDPNLIYVVAFVFGFSESFFRSTIGKISGERQQHGEGR